jgi:spermidine synthase
MPGLGSEIIALAAGNSRPRAQGEAPVQRTRHNAQRGSDAVPALAKKPIPPAPQPAAPTEATRPGRLGSLLVVTVFVASGAAGLMYQVIWSHELVLVFGNTTEAIGAIVTAFMAGLGLGALVGGALAPRLRSALRLYGLVELAVAGLALLVPVVFGLIEGAYRSAYDTASPGQLTLVRLLLALATVTPVTLLMGLTLPLLTRHMVTSMRSAGAHMGRLYAANTFGAMLGTLVSGFVLIELIGLWATTLVAVGLNLLAAVVAVATSLRVPASADRETLRLADVVSDHAHLRSGLRGVLYCATFVSGFVALALEVLWTRMLAEGSGSSIYVFALILAIFLFGIAAGGAVYRARSPERDTPLALAHAFAGVAVGTFATVPVLTVLVPVITWLVPGAGNAPALYGLRAVALLPATLCMGYAFPLTARLLARDPAHSARSIGSLYAWNTLGSLLGSLAAAFVLAGTLGTNASVLLLGAADAVVALALVAAGAGSLPARPRRLTAVAAAFVALPVLLVATNSVLLMTATEHRIAFSGLPFRHLEDRISTVDAVGGAPQDRRLYSSGTAMTALSVDTKLMAYVPKIVRPNAQDFLDICFGMGTTFRSAQRLGMNVDAVDLSPSVPWQMPTFYDDASQYLFSPHTRIVTADGRNYVHLTSRRYDLISVDPPPPIESAGAVVLYSREFYTDARGVLRPGGLMLQWLYFGLDMDQFKEHLRTFRSAFAHTSILISPRGGGVHMLGSDAPITWDDATVERFMDTEQASVDLHGAPDYRYLPAGTWPQLIDHALWLRDGDVDQFAGTGPMITDDQPLTEYYLLHHLFTPDSGTHVTEAVLRRLWPSP